jgi:hypothetical protein
MATNNPTLQGSAVGQIPVQRKSWLGRNWKWLLAVTFLLMVCVGLGIFALIMSESSGKSRSRAEAWWPDRRGLVDQRFNQCGYGRFRRG